MREAFAHINRTRDAAIEELIRICEIPAPPFKEEARAEYVKSRFEELGLAHVRADEEGNIIAERTGASRRPSVIVSAHLDTVFPEGTDVRVRSEGNRLYAPGISDNTCGVASITELARALNAASHRDRRHGLFRRHGRGRGRRQSARSPSPVHQRRVPRRR